MHGCTAVRLSWLLPEPQTHGKPSASARGSIRGFPKTRKTATVPAALSHGIFHYSSPFTCSRLKDLAPISRNFLHTEHPSLGFRSAQQSSCYQQRFHIASSRTYSQELLDTSKVIFTALCRARVQVPGSHKAFLTASPVPGEAGATGTVAAPEP